MSASHSLTSLTGTARAVGLFALAVAAFSAMLLLSLHGSRDAEALVLLPLVATGCVLAGVGLLFACAGSVPCLVAFLAVIVFMNDTAFRQRDAGDLSLDWQNGFKFLLWAAAAAIGGAHLGMTWRNFCRYPAAFALVYIAYALTSSVYSAAPLYSFTTAFGLLSMLFLAGALAARLTEKQILLCVVLSLWAFILVGLVVSVAVPSLGRSIYFGEDGAIIDRLCGLAGQANALGGETVISLACVFLLWYRGHCRALVLLPIAATSLYALLATDSRTSLLALLVGITAVIARRSLWRWGSALLGVSLGAILLLGVPLRDLASFTGGFSRSGDPNEIFTLTGRTEIWAFAWDRIVERPWVGHGYNASKYILPLFLGLQGLQVDEAHNMWLQNLLGGGILGTAPLAALAICLLVEYVRVPDPIRDLFTFIFLVWGVSSVGAIGGTPMVMTLVLFLSMLIDGERRPISSRDSRQRLPRSWPLVPSVALKPR